MWANVYLVMEQRGNSVDTYMIHPTQDDALAYYKQVTGRPGRIDERVNQDGFEHLIVDADGPGSKAIISQHKVHVSELIDAP